MKLKFDMLVPLRFNDGSLIPERVRTDLEDEFIACYGGFTVEGTKHGAYRMASGKRQDDVSIQYSVIIDDDQEDQLKAYVRELAKVCKQECILLMKSPCEIYFIEPPAEEGKAQ